MMFYLKLTTSYESDMFPWCGRFNFTPTIQLHLISMSKYLYLILWTPSFTTGGAPKIITSHIWSKQPICSAWTQEWLDFKCAIALGQAVDTSTWSCYSSSLNAYLDFVKKHNFPVEPNPDTLSYFTVFMSYYIKPSSVNSYLSGICQQLEHFFPDVHKHQKSLLVHHTLNGCKQLHISSTKWKQVLMCNDLHLVMSHYRCSTLHDDLLFIAQLLTGFFALLQLGELTFPDDVHLHNPSKITKWSPVTIDENSFTFFLPSHIGNRFFWRKHYSPPEVSVPQHPHLLSLQYLFNLMQPSLSF